MNKPQENPEFRNYEGVIAASKEKVYFQASKTVIKEGQARRKVDELQEQRRLKKEIDPWNLM